jgi:acyl carrier protein
MSHIEDVVRRLIVQSLRLNRNPEEIAIDADLFQGDLGLDSVDAVQLVTSIEKHFDIHLSDGDLARHPLTSVRAITNLLQIRGLDSVNLAKDPKR